MSTPRPSYFIIISILAHLVLLAGGRMSLVDVRPVSQAIDVSFYTDNSPYEKTQQETLATKQLNNQSINDSLSTINNHATNVRDDLSGEIISDGQTYTTAPSAIMEPNHVAHKEPSPQSNNEIKPSRTEQHNNQQRILASLKQAMTNHFIYPRLARRRGWEGKVLLSFRIERDGHLQDIQVTKSSGYKLLDRSAVRALSKVNKIPWQNINTIDMQLPVVYQLHEG